MRTITSVFLLLLIAGCGLLPSRGYLPPRDYPTPEQVEFAAKWKVDGEPLDQYPEKEFSDLKVLSGKKGNAAEFYVRAFKLFKGGANSKVPEKGIALVLQGARVKSCDFEPYLLAPTTTPAVVPDMSAANAYTWAIIKLAATAENDGRATKAENLLKCVIALGYHIQIERTSLYRVTTGLSIQLHSARELKELLRRLGLEEKTKIADKFHSAVKENFNRIMNKRVGVSFEKFIALKACIDTVKNDPQPLWRKEACLTLAVLRHLKASDLTTRSSYAGMKGLADHVLKDAVENDQDPSVRVWAVWCLANVTRASVRRR